MNYALNRLKGIETNLKTKLNYCMTEETQRIFHDQLQDVKQVIADHEEKEAQRQMAKEAGDDN